MGFLYGKEAFFMEADAAVRPRCLEKKRFKIESRQSGRMRGNNGKKNDCNCARQGKL